MKSLDRKQKLVGVVLAIALLFFGFVAGWAGSRRLSKMTYEDIKRSYLTERGDAPAAVREEVLSSLHAFQNGYLHRDPDQLESFMQLLFPQDQHLLLTGTDIGEWRRGYESIQRFILADWLKWGDVRLELDESVICSQDNVAWVNTIGTVGFNGLERPIRFSAVLARIENRWMFRNIQFQWENTSVRIRELFQPSVLRKLHFR